MRVVDTRPWYEALVTDLERPTESQATATVMVVDDEPQMLRICERLLTRERFAANCFSDPREALAALRAASRAPDAVLTDLHMPGMSGLELLEAVRDAWPTLPVVMMTGKATVTSAVEAMRLGAYDYVVKPFEPIETLIVALRRAVEHKALIERNRVLQLQLSQRDRFEEIVGSSASMREVYSVVTSVAPTDTTALILGESGTGKELVARAIHRESLRSGRSFVAINCAALTESVLESELFGHVRGAFTGAVSSRRGLIEEASGGTLFLDEIGELPQSTQVRLLRVLQERQIRPVGSNESRFVDVRIVAATHRDLAALVEQGTFRQDLYYRLNVVRVEVPPLRTRRGDIPLLIQHFIAKHCAHHHKTISGVEPEALQRLMRYDWPGNVRELENVLERAIVLSREESISAELLPSELWETPSAEADPVAAFIATGELMPYGDARNVFERSYLERSMAAADGNISQAARVAGVDRSNFKRMLKRHDML
jgi:two-component system response regulator HydG